MNMSKSPNKKFKIFSYIISVSAIFIIIYRYGFSIVLFFTAPQKIFPYTEKEYFFLDSIRFNNKYNRVERDKIYYSRTWLLDTKTDFVINIEIRKSKNEINYLKLKNDAKIIAYRACKNFNYDDNKTNNFVVNYNIVKNLPITDSTVLENNSNKYYYPNQIDTTIVHSFSKSNLIH